jgi:hypothetical protein
MGFNAMHAWHAGAEYQRSDGGMFVLNRLF